MDERPRWVLLAYRLPREPSTPRIALWRKLRQLGAVQLLDNLVALPAAPQTQEQLEWLADSVTEAGGEASVWLGEPTVGAHHRALVAELQAARREEYQAILAAAQQAERDSGSARRRTLDRLRREMRRIRARDYLGAPERMAADAALDRLAQVVEVER